MEALAWMHSVVEQTAAAAAASDNVMQINTASLMQDDLISASFNDKLWC